MKLTNQCMELYCNKINRTYGIIGTPTELIDINKNELCVGDVVILKRQDCKWSRMRFVAYDEENNKFYIMGAYIDASDFNVELAVNHSSLSEGFAIGNVYYRKYNKHGGNNKNDRLKWHRIFKLKTLFRNGSKNKRNKN